MPRIADPDSPTKKGLLDAAAKLVLEEGFAATSVEDVCSAAGLTKGSFFHYFGSKEELASALLEDHVARRSKEFAAAPFQRLADPLRRVYGAVDYVAETCREEARAGGCLLGNFAQELAFSHPGIRAACDDCFSGQAEWFARELAAAKRLHAPRASFDPAGLAEHWVAVAQGAVLLAKTKRDPGVAAKSLGHFKRYLKGLFER